MGAERVTGVFHPPARSSNHCSGLNWARPKIAAKISTQVSHVTGAQGFGLSSVLSRAHEQGAESKWSFQGPTRVCVGLQRLQQ